MRGVLLHVEEVGALRLLRPADAVREEALQPPPWSDVSAGSGRAGGRAGCLAGCAGHGLFSRDYMDRLVDETEALGGTVSSPVLTANRPEPVPDPQLNILNSFTAGDLTGKGLGAQLGLESSPSRPHAG